MFAAALQRLLRRESLDREEAQALLRHILAGEASEIQIAALLTALASKGETVEELIGFAAAMRAASADLGVGRGLEGVVDTCGTGGDGSGTFNISTAAAFTAAGAGVRVAKHGNRSISSRCGSADVAEGLGVQLEISPGAMGECLRDLGIAFLYAPRLHPATARVQSTRRALQVRTIFNLLGPLTNPAGAHAQVIGVYAEEWLEPMAGALAGLGVERAWVVRGRDGLDELSTCAPTEVCEVRNGRLARFQLEADQFGIPRADPAALQGGTCETNCAIVRGVLQGKAGPQRDIVVWNAAAALVVGGRAADLREGVSLAAAALGNGAALAKLEALAAATQTALRAAAHPA